MPDAPGAVTSRGELLAWIADRGLPRTEPQPCSYLEGRRSSIEGFLADSLDAETYRGLMEQGFRRSGRLFYRNACPHCSACLPLRVPVAEFSPSRSQRRTLRRNRDVRARVGVPELDDAKRALYRRYLDHQHPGSSQGEDPDGVEEFLYSAVVPSCEVVYEAEGQLLGASILDVSAESVSSVYHYFDPAAARRRLGVLSILTEIALAHAWGASHYYLGFWIDGCRTMHYKAEYFPHELLVGDRWARVERSVP